MKKEKTEELFVKWIDGELSSADGEVFTTLLENDPGLKEELTEMKRVSGEVRAEVPASVEPPYGDFFNSQLMRKVDLEIVAKRPVERAERWWESLRWAWAPAGALALVLSFFAGHRLGNPGRETAPAVAQTPSVPPESITLPTVYSAGNALEAEVIADSDGEVTAIVVNGISAISDEVDFTATVTTHLDSADLPPTYRRAEGRRFD